MTKQIEARAVTKTFQATDAALVPALEALDLDIDKQEFVCVVGPSGCGKSTLLTLLAGLEHPTSGELRIGGKLVEEPRPEVAMVFQEHSLLPWKTVLENVGIGLKARGIPRGERESISRRFIVMAGLGGFEHKYPYELSGGMKQRVGIARALAVEPAVLLMDEPFGALDAQTRTLFQAELLQIYDQFRRTILFVTHDVSEAVFLADRVVVMTFRPGRVKQIFDVDIKRPRTLNVLEDHHFLNTRAHVWEALKEEAAKAFSLDAAT
jgi:NitT/TauT family transport system ATP-binding protein